MGFLFNLGVVGVLLGVGGFLATRPRQRGALFEPSPLAVLAAVKSTTAYDPNNDKKAMSQKYAGSRSLLVLATQDNDLAMQNGKRFATGNHPVEMLVPLLHVKNAGVKIVIATPTGKPVAMEEWALPLKDDAVMSLYRELQPSLQKPISFAQAASAKDTYVGIFLVGGHGAIRALDHAEAQKPLQTLLDDALASQDTAVAVICHGPALLLAASPSATKGRSLVSFPDFFDENVAPYMGYLPGKMQWLLGARLQEKAGMNLINANAFAPSGETHQDRLLLSGDSPDAAEPLGRLLARKLIELK